VLFDGSTRVEEFLMGIDFDALKNKAQDALKQHGDKIDQGIDKAAGFAKGKIAGHDSQIDGATEKAKAFLDKFEGKPDQTPPPEPPPAPPA
jgi:ABC-type transporter Mla subunit MlaD